MKKFLAAAGLALLLTELVPQPAHAWINWKFGVGANLSWQSGGNNLLWGAWRGGQPPGPAGHPYGQPGFQPPGPGFQPPMSGTEFQPETGEIGAPDQPPMFPSHLPSTVPTVFPGFQTVSYPGYYVVPSYYYPAMYGR